MIRYAITGRASLEPPTLGNLLAAVRGVLERGVDFLQVREKGLTARELAELVRRIAALPNPHDARILVNERPDVALACGAAGVHLPGGSIAPAEIRRIAPPGFVISVACHTLAEVEAAAREGADYALFSPVFRPLSKADNRPVHGLEGLRAACRAARIPVLALGGITRENASACVAAGAAGVAGVTLFQELETHAPPMP